MDDSQFRIVVQRSPGPPQNDVQPGDVDLPMMALVYRGLDASNPHIVRGFTEEDVLTQAKGWADAQIADERAAQNERVYIYDPASNSIGMAQ